MHIAATGLDEQIGCRAHHGVRGQTGGGIRATALCTDDQVRRSKLGALRQRDVLQKLDHDTRALFDSAQIAASLVDLDRLHRLARLGDPLGQHVGIGALASQTHHQHRAVLRMLAQGYDLVKGGFPQGTATRIAE